MNPLEIRHRSPLGANWLLVGAAAAFASPGIHGAPFAQDTVAGAAFTVRSCVVTEGQSGTAACDFVITLASPSTGPLELTYRTASTDNLLGSADEASLEAPRVGSESLIFGTGSELGAWLVESGNVELKSWSNWQPAHDRQSLDLHGDRPGALGRDIATEPGQTYTVSFAHAGHPVCVTPVTTLTASFGSQSLGTFRFDSTGHSLQDMGWHYEAITVIATAPSTRIRFASTTPGGCGPALDDLAVSAVGVASSGIDFLPAWRHGDEPLILPTGTTTHTVPVTVFGDTRTEGYEDFVLEVCIAGLGCETAIGGIDEGAQDVLFRSGFEEG